MPARRFLFLQGPLSPLFRRVGQRLAAAGHHVRRMNFCAGDWFYWHGAETSAFRGPFEEWPAHVAAVMEGEGVTDLVIHGDRRPYHKIAVAEATARGLRVIVTELGYLRSGWMTIEQGGCSTLSRFPTDPEHIRRIAAAVGPIDLTARYPESFVRRAAQDVTYHSANLLFSFAYPRYRRHTPLNPVVDYSAWAARLATSGTRARNAAKQQAALLEDARPFFLVPLQVEGDYQLIAHSPFAGMAEALERVFQSFAAHAPKAARLVVKSHPLDNGYLNWRRCIQELAMRNGIGDRVVLLDGGVLPVLLARARGMVTVNSTAGLEALTAGVPVKTIAVPIYDIAGMTHRGSLDEFWAAPQPPDGDLVTAFIRAVAATIQACGSIHNSEGLEAAVDSMSRRILEDRLNAPDAFVDPPPRLDRARGLGVPL